MPNITYMAIKTFMIIYCKLLVIYNEKELDGIIAECEEEAKHKEAIK